MFVLSATIMIMFLIKVVSCIVGNSMHVPIPVLHVMDWDFANTYISTPALAYQVYFWASYAGLTT